MVVINESILSLPSAAIIIDPWNTILGQPYNFSLDWTPYLHSHMDNMIDFIKNNSNIKAVLLASYSAADGLSQEFINNSQWHKTYFEINNQPRITSKKILEFKDPNKTLTLGLSQDDLVRVFKLHSGIRNFYIMGSEYHQCIQDRPLGIKAFWNKHFKLLSTMAQVNKEEFNILLNSECIVEAKMIDGKVEQIHPDLTLDPDCQRVGASNIFKVVSQGEYRPRLGWNFDNDGNPTRRYLPY
jgi:hypothetical protein